MRYSARCDIKQAKRRRRFRRGRHTSRPGGGTRRFAAPCFVSSRFSTSPEAGTIERMTCPLILLRTESDSAYVGLTSRRFVVVTASAWVAECFASDFAICRTRSRCHAWCCADEVADASPVLFGRLAGKNKVVGMPASPSHKAQCVVANGVLVAVLQHIDSRVSSAVRSIAS